MTPLAAGRVAPARVRLGPVRRGPARPGIDPSGTGVWGSAGCGTWPPR